MPSESNSRKEVIIVTEDQVNEVFASENALGKKICVELELKAEKPFNDPRNSFAYVIRQLLDPENFRPPKTLEWRVDHTQYKNLSEKDAPFQVRESRARGLPKENYFFTKKTAVTLLPHDGVISLYGGDAIVMVFDLRRCRAKEWPGLAPESGKYTFANNAGTDGRGWLKGGTLFAPWTPIDKIRENNRDARAKKDVLRHNEMLVCLEGKQKGEGATALCAIGLHDNWDNVEWRLNAQYQRLLVLQHLNVDVPILFLSGNDARPMRFYTQEFQASDLQSALKKGKDSNEYQSAAAVIALQEKIERDYPVEPRAQ
ncbi:MAG: hypothetical protein NTZ67_02485 [Gammaproteobacteria bacterium]|nr:hypothetical protein [Gammaproteobacteria bacterium]